MHFSLPTVCEATKLLYMDVACYNICPLNIIINFQNNLYGWPYTYREICKNDLKMQITESVRQSISHYVFCILRPLFPFLHLARHTLFVVIRKQRRNHFFDKKFEFCEIWRKCVYGLFFIGSNFCEQHANLFRKMPLCFVQRPLHEAKTAQSAEQKNLFVKHQRKHSTHCPSFVAFSSVHLFFAAAREWCVAGFSQYFAPRSAFVRKVKGFRGLLFFLCINRMRNLHGIRKVYSKCFVFHGVFCENIRNTKSA